MHSVSSEVSPGAWASQTRAMSKEDKKKQGGGILRSKKKAEGNSDFLNLSWDGLFLHASV